MKCGVPRRPSCCPKARRPKVCWDASTPQAPAFYGGSEPAARGRFSSAASPSVCCEAVLRNPIRIELIEIVEQALGASSP